MKTTHGRKTHEGSKHSHHEHATRLHHDAAKHYNEGKDFAHAAHQALVAHGHALLALALAQEAYDRYLKLSHLEPAPATPSAMRCEPISLSPAGLVQGSQHVCEHHLAAAELHEHAARYLSQADEHHAQGDVALAAHEAQAAHALTLCAIDHANQAAKHHAAGCCVADPAARQVLPVAA